jgi:ABC-type nitrate/sulfonate/bicarbonate transport system substrate-binding protein
MKAIRSMFAVLLVVVSMGFSGHAAAQQKVRLAILPFSESLAAIAADKEGYFKAEGLEVEMIKVNSGALSLPLLVSGSIDIAFSNTISTLQALEQGLDGIILAPGATSRAQTPDATTSLLALKGGAIRTPKDLEGKRIAINVINSSAWMYMIALLDKYGVDRSKVQFVEVPFPQMNAPLLNKQFDAAGQVDPFTTIALKTGKVEAIAYPYVEVQPNADITQYIALRAWVKNNPAVASRFVRAIAKGAEFVNSPANTAAVRDLNQKFINLAPELKDSVQLPRLGTSVNGTEVRNTMNMMLKYGLLKRPIDLNGRIYVQQQ